MKLGRLNLSELEERTPSFEEEVLRTVIGGCYGTDGGNASGYGNTSTSGATWEDIFKTLSGPTASAVSTMIDSWLKNNVAGNTQGAVTILYGGYLNSNGKISNEKYAYDVITTLVSATVGGAVGGMVGAATYSYEQAYEYMKKLVYDINKYFNPTTTYTTYYGM